MLFVIVIVQGVYLWRLWQAQRRGLRDLWQHAHSLSRLPGQIQLRDEKEGTSCWLGPSGISFSGPGERIDTSREPPSLSQQKHIERIDLSIDYMGRASLQLFGHRQGYESLGDFAQDAEIGVEKDGAVRFKLGNEILWTSKQEEDGTSELVQIEQARKDFGALVNLHGDLLRRIESLKARARGRLLQASKTSPLLLRRGTENALRPVPVTRLWVAIGSCA